MGFSRKRAGKGGAVRYTAYYTDLRGRERSAGTFSSKKQADRAWQREESRVAEGRIGDLRRGRQIFQRYVEEEWLPHHVIEATTRQGYTYSINKHLLPWFGGMRMIDVLPQHVREWVTDLKAQGTSPKTIHNLRAILSAIFTTALNDQVTFLHPCKGVKIPTVPVKPRQIVTPEQFDAIYGALSLEDARLLVETDIESGMRWGELTELRVKDLDLASRIVTISRTVIEVNPKFHPTGGRFLVKDYPKGKEYRRFKLSPQIVAKHKDHIRDNGLGPDDLLFAMPEESIFPKRRNHIVHDKLGQTQPNSAGRTYQHGTLSGYSAGKCRCDHCRAAYATYRATRRATGKDSPRGTRVPDSDGHIPRSWFRVQVWQRALKSAEIDFPVRMHDLRHAHASWLLAGGADLQVVKERLGHASIATTEKYLHTLPEADETALSALHSIRSRNKFA